MEVEMDMEMQVEMEVVMEVEINMEVVMEIKGEIENGRQLLQTPETDFQTGRSVAKTYKDYKRHA